MSRATGPGTVTTQAAASRTGPPRRCWKCSVFGHRIRFRADGNTMVWSCEWCGGERGAKTYESAVAARNFARAFDRRDSEDTGRRAPWLGMFPLRVWRLLRDRGDRR